MGNSGIAGPRRANRAVFELDPKVWRLAGTSLAFFAAIVFAVWLIFRIRSRYRGHEDPAADEQRMLMQLRDLRRQGDLSDDEYRSIKGRLAKRLDGLSKSDAESEKATADRQQMPES
jgi:hypothetical protein